MLFSDSVTHYLCLFSVSNLLLDCSPDTNTLEGGVTCCNMDCRFHFNQGSFASLNTITQIYI